MRCERALASATKDLRRDSAVWGCDIPALLPTFFISRTGGILTSESSSFHDYLYSISRPGAAKVNGWTLLHSISPVYLLLLLPLFPAPLAQDIFIGSIQHLTSRHLTQLGITLLVNCSADAEVAPPPPPAVSVRWDDERHGAAHVHHTSLASACLSHVRSSTSRWCVVGAGGWVARYGPAPPAPPVRRRPATAADRLQQLVAERHGVSGRPRNGAPDAGRSRRPGVQNLTVISTLSRLTSASPASVTPPPHHDYLDIISPRTHLTSECFPAITSSLSHKCRECHRYLCNIPSLSHRGPTSVAPVPCIIGPVSLQYLVSISPVSHQYLTIPIISPVSHERLTSILSPVSHHHLASISPVPWYLTVLPVPSSLPARRRASWRTTSGSRSCASMRATTSRPAPWPCCWS